jgi:hypothetical protein
MAAVGLALLPGSLRAEFVYLASSGIITAYHVDNVTGAVTPVPGSPFPGWDFLSRCYGCFRTIRLCDKQ